MDYIKNLKKTGANDPEKERSDVKQVHNNAKERKEILVKPESLKEMLIWQFVF